MTYKTYCDFHGCTRVESKDEPFTDIGYSCGRDDYRSKDLCREHLKMVIDFIDGE